MSTTLDDKVLFDEQDLNVQIGSWQRAAVERAVPGLNGMLSIDLGRRTRTIRQRGSLRAASRAQLSTRLCDIEAFLDGGTHTLITADGHAHAHLRMDGFTPADRHVSGAGIVVEYEIVYTQLGS